MQTCGKNLMAHSLLAAITANHVPTTIGIMDCDMHRDSSERSEIKQNQLSSHFEWHNARSAFKCTVVAWLQLKALALEGFIAA